MTDEIELFVDSSGWIALYDGQDQFHTVAKAALRSLRSYHLRLVTTDYVFDEAITFILNRTYHAAAVQFGRWLLNANNIELIRVDETVWQTAWKMFQRYHDKEWAFTDCTSFVLMRQLGLYQAFTFDHHFAQAGFQLWPAQ
jgi:predicted nucleic acid-binding protein